MLFRKYVVFAAVSEEMDRQINTVVSVKTRQEHLKFERKIGWELNAGPSGGEKFLVSAIEIEKY